MRKMFFQRTAHRTKGRPGKPQLWHPASQEAHPAQATATEADRRIDPQRDLDSTLENCNPRGKRRRGIVEEGDEIQFSSSFGLFPLSPPLLFAAAIYAATVEVGGRRGGKVGSTSSHVPPGQKGGKQTGLAAEEKKSPNPRAERKGEIGKVGISQETCSRRRIPLPRAKQVVSCECGNGFSPPRLPRKCIFRRNMAFSPSFASRGRLSQRGKRYLRTYATLFLFIS